MSRDRGPEIVTAGAFDRAEALISYTSYFFPVLPVGLFIFFEDYTIYTPILSSQRGHVWIFFEVFGHLRRVTGGRQVEFQNEEERREAIDHIRLMARRKYLGEREARARWAGVRFTKYKGRTMGEPTRRGLGQIVYNQWNMLMWQFVSQTYYIINTLLILHIFLNNMLFKCVYIYKWKN